jgi:hypothetical protein
MSQINVPVLPSAVLLHIRAMEKLQQQVAQHEAVLRQAGAPIVAANAVIKQATVALIPGLHAINEQCAQITRAHVYLVNQYNKSPKAKAKRAHAALIEVCQTALRKIARRKTLRQVAAEFLQLVVVDVRTVMRELLQVHRANAPNRCADLFMTHLPKVANTNL